MADVLHAPLPIPQAIPPLVAWAAAAAAWLLTWALHATLLLGAAWVAHRVALGRAGRERAADLLWKLALVGGLASAAAQAALDVEPLGGRVSVPRRPAPTRVTYDVVELAAGGAARGPGPRPSVALPPLPPLPPDRRPWLAGALALWLAVAAGRAARRVRAHRRGLAPLARRRPVVDPAVLAEAAALAHAAGLRRTPRVSVVEGVAMPVATARGEICLPARALASLAPEELRAVLAHEIAHLRRADPRWLWAFALLGDLCWVQPLHRVALATFADGAELLCDAWAAEATGRPRALARSLAAVGEWALAAGDAPPATAAAMARGRSPLARRVERLLAPAATRPAAPRWLTRGVAAAAVAAIVGAAWAAPRLVPPGAWKPRLVLLEETAVRVRAPR